MDKTTENNFVNTQRLLESANNSARHFRSFYATYLRVMTYTLFVILFTNQKLLFSDGYMLLPQVNIYVPITEFFIYMPWVLLIIHFYLLTQISFLADKVQNYVLRIKEKLESQEEIDKAYGLLFLLPFDHTFVARKPQWFLSFIIFFSLIIFPLVTLIVIQIKFLPYQSEWVTWQHRVVIIIDLTLLWYFWYQIYISKNKNLRIEKLSKQLLYFTVSFFTLTTILIIVFVRVLDFPNKNPTSYGNPNLFQFYNLISEMIPTHFNLPNSILVKKEPPSEILAACDICEDKSVTKWCELAEPLNLRNRNFRKANLYKAKICSANLTGADLTRAILVNAVLPEAKLTKADLTEADLSQAILTQTDLTQANLSEANLIGVDLSQAVLTEANLSQAILIEADIREVDLSQAILIEADIRGADLTGALLIRADLRSANLAKSDFTKADLSEANLFGVNLSGTNFADATMVNTNIDYSWIWENPNTENTEYLPVGIPKGWKDTLKPDYLCPQQFDIDDYVDFSEYTNERQKLRDELSGSALEDALNNLKSELRTELAGIIEENCEPYEPKTP